MNYENLKSLSESEKLSLLKAEGFKLKLKGIELEQETQDKLFNEVFSEFKKFFLFVLHSDNDYDFQDMLFLIKNSIDPQKIGKDEIIKQMVITEYFEYLRETPMAIKTIAGDLYISENIDIDFLSDLVDENNLADLSGDAELFSIVDYSTFKELSQDKCTCKHQRFVLDSMGYSEKDIEKFMQGYTCEVCNK